MPVARVELSPKTTGVLRNYTFDFTPFLAAGETISAPVASASVYSGNDASPSAILGSPSASGNVVTLPLTAGVIGVIYEVSVTVTTSAAQTPRLSGYLAIVPDLP